MMTTSIANIPIVVAYTLKACIATPVQPNLGVLLVPSIHYTAIHLLTHVFPYFVTTPAL